MQEIQNTQEPSKIQRIQLPSQVEMILDKLSRNGFEAYAVGGCVRDALMRRPPGDWDITTSARPQEIKKIFRHTADTGIRHGTVTVIMNRIGYEVTTYRIDGAYTDSRHPESVTFTSDLAEDLKRRDFTINAMAYSHRTGIVDIFDGIGDLRRKVVRCVGNPFERFHEDALRILRAVRFSAQLGFAIGRETKEAAAVMSPGIARISKERIQAELTKILLSDSPEKIREVFEIGASAYLCPGFGEIPWEKLEIPSSLPALKYVRWSAFLRSLPPEEAAGILRGLKMDNGTIAKTKLLAAWSGKRLEENAFSVRKAMSQMPPDVWDSLVELNQYSARIRELAESVRSAGDCLGLDGLAVKGQDLISMGMPPGREIGEVLNRMLEEVLEHPGHNRKELLLGKFLPTNSKS